MTERLSVCPALFGEVDIRVIDNSSESKSFETNFLELEGGRLRWYEDKEKTICRGVAFLVNKSSFVKDGATTSDTKEDGKKVKILRCPVNLQSGPALVDLRLKHSKLWQLAIDTHFTRCFKPLSDIPSYAYDLDGARFNHIHLSAVAKITVNGVNYDLPLALMDDVDDKVDLLFPSSTRSIPRETRRDVVAALLRTQNQMVFEVVRRYHHLEQADFLQERALANMTQRAENAEAHADVLSSYISRIESLLPELQQQVAFPSAAAIDQRPNQRQDTVAPTDVPHYMTPLGSQQLRQQVENNNNNTDNNSRSGGVSWRRRWEETNAQLEETTRALSDARQDLRYHTSEAPQRQRQQALESENSRLREVTATMRSEIVRLHEQLRDIQQSALQNLELLQQQQPAQEIALSSDPALGEPFTVRVDLSRLVENARSPGIAPGLGTSGTSMLMLRDRDGDDDDDNDDHQVFEENKHSMSRSSLSRRSYQRPSANSNNNNSNSRFVIDDHDDEYSPAPPEEDLQPVLLLEADNWTNKYADFLIQQHGRSVDGSGPGRLVPWPVQDVVQSLGWSLCEERFIAAIYQHYLAVPYSSGTHPTNNSNSNNNSSNNSSHHPVGMSSTKFLRFIKDFQLLAAGSLAPPTAATHAHHVSSSHEHRMAYYEQRGLQSHSNAGKQPPTTTSTSNKSGGSPRTTSNTTSGQLDRLLTHAEISAAYMVASSTQLPGDRPISQGGVGGGGTSGSGGVTSPGGAFKVAGGHRSVHDVLDFYHTQHLFVQRNNSNMNNTTPSAADGSSGIVINTVSATLSLAQFTLALALLAEKRYAKLLSQALSSPSSSAAQQASPHGGINGGPVERRKAQRAMMELLWLNTLVPMSMRLDLVPAGLVALRVLLSHVHSEGVQLLTTLASATASMCATDTASASSSTPAAVTFTLAQRLEYLPRTGLLRLLTQHKHMVLVSRLFRRYIALQSANRLSVKSRSGSNVNSSSLRGYSNANNDDDEGDGVLLQAVHWEPLGVAEALSRFRGSAYLRHRLFSHRLRLGFPACRAMALQLGLVPYLLGEHQLYAIFSDLAQLWSPQEPSSTPRSPNSKQSAAAGTGAAATLAKRFPPLQLPEELAEALSQADQAVVAHLRQSESIKTAWSSKQQQSGSGPDGATQTLPLQSSLDLSCFLVFLGTVAMKIFPHVEPRQRLDSLLSLLLQNWHSATGEDDDFDAILPLADAATAQT